MNENQIIALHTRLNFPGVDATLLAAKKWARSQNPPLDPPTKAQVAEVIRKRTTKQVFTPARTTVGGHHASPGPGLYQHDLVSMEAVQGKRNKDFNHIYLLISIFSRKMYARRLSDKDPETVRDALQSIINGMPASEVPKDIAGDDDGAFKGAFATYLAGRNPPISLRMTTAKEGKSVIDSAIYHFKRALYADMQQRNSTSWIEHYDRVLRGYNEKPHSTLGMAAPNDVRSADGKSWLEYALLVRNTKHMEQNAKAWDRSRKGLEQGDKFRAPVKRKQRGFQRGYTMTYAKEIHTVQGFRENGRLVVSNHVDSQGRPKTFRVSAVLPVPADSVPAQTHAIDYAERTRRQQIREERGFV